MSWITGADVLAQPGTPSWVTAAQATAAADGACDLIQTWCNRDIEATDYREWTVPLGPQLLEVQNPPLIHVLRLASDTQWCISLTNTSAGATDAQVSCSGTDLTVSVFGGAFAHSTQFVLATYGTMALLLAAIVALPNNWAGVVLNEDDPRNLRLESLGTALNATVYLSGPDGAVSVDRITNENGLLYAASSFELASSHKVFIQYRGGYEAATFPPGLMGITLRLAVDALRITTMSAMMQSESLGKYSWVRRLLPASTDFGNLRALYLKELQPWRKVSV